MTQPTAPAPRRPPWAPSLPGALALVLLAAVFFRAGAAPVAHLDSWSDWKYGQWIWEHGRLPEREPFSPYGDPTPGVRDARWLAEVAYYLVADRAGLEGVALLHALLEVAKAALFLAAVRLATGSPGTAVLAAALMEAACWPFFGAVRTSVPAEVCWAALLLACSARVPSWGAVVAVPILVALWTNLGPTFTVAFLLLGGLLLGRFLDESRARRSLTRAARDPGVRRLALMLALLALVAAWVNRYRTELVTETVAQAVRPDPLRVLPARQWSNLVPVDTPESRALIASVVVVLVTLRLSPRRFTASEVVLLVPFVVWAWFDKRVAPWWLMLGPWLLAPHWKATWEAARGVGQVSTLPAKEAGWKPAPRWLFALGAAVAAALVLLSPAARWLYGRPLPPQERAGPMAPYHLANAMTGHEAAPRRVFNAPYWWGDYLLWRLPPTDSVYWYSHPAGYLNRQSGTLAGEDPSSREWRALVERYRFNTLVVQADSSALYAYLKEAPPGEWEVVSDNTADGAPGGGPASRGLVAVRRLDPFVLSLAQADAAQSCVGGLGLAPTAGSWSVLTHLPWVWPPARDQRPEIRDQQSQP